MLSETVSHYRLIRKLGAGGMGEVYLAEDTRLNRKIALKLLPENFTRDEDRLQRFIQEARAASALNHPNIITIYDFGHVDSLNFIASEFIEGKTLREHRQQTGMQLGEVLDVAVQIAGALSAAHDAGIIHRDIKPDNVMIRPDGYVKVLDFGLAKLVEQQTPSTDTQAPTVAKVSTQPGMLLGTFGYMAPEQARGKDVDARTDIFSFGVLLYEVITGRAPFEGETTSDLIASILMGEPQPISYYLPGSPAELQRIISKALRKNKEERYQTMKDMLVDLRSLKQQLEFETKLKQSLSSDTGSGFGIAATSGTAPPHSTAQAEHSSHQPAARTVSSAEYVVSGIRRNIKAVAIALVALAVATGVVLYFTRDANTIDSLAVLPLANDSGDSNADYLSDGLTESIIYNLSQLQNLRVMPRSSVFRYKGRQVDTREVGRELGARAVLTGRVAQRGADIMVSVELVDTKDNRVIWGQQFNRSTNDALSIQQEISKDIYEKLRPNLLGEGERVAFKRTTEDTEAYQAYLKGLYWLNKRTEEGFRKAIEFFNKALEEDPGYAWPYAGLADCYALQSTYGLLAPREGFPKAKAAAVKALSIDQTLAEAHTSLANTLTSYDWEFTSAEQEFRRALELNPNYATAHQWYAEYLSAMGRHTEAIAEIKRAEEIDPLSLIINAVHGRVLYCARRYDEAITQLLKTIEMDQRFGPAYVFLCAAYQKKGAHGQAVSAAQEAVKLSPNTSVYLTILGHAYAVSGETKQAREILDQMVALSGKQYIQPSYVGLLYSGLGDRDRAFEWFERAYAERDDRLIFVLTEPLMDTVRPDARFSTLLRSIGLPQS
jgi:serine/threonine protein kinase/Tfp pilus assembly protein PilF